MGARPGMDWLNRIGLKVKKRTIYMGAAIIVVSITMATAAFHTCVADETGATSVKTRSIYYTPEKITIARQNIEKYDWAKSIKKSAVASADQFVALGYKGLWEAVPSQAIPRAYIVNKEVGSPVTGKKIDSYGAYPYKHDPIKDPWKITDPSSGYRFPTNDFAAYYTSGLDEHGEFNPKLANRSLLVNELYPEKGKTWGVDDGYGWVDENGNKFTFIAYYAHWAQWKNLISNGITDLRDAYLYTGDRKYAYAGIVLLDRIADVYPKLDLSVYKWEDGFENSHGYTMQGKIVGSILETELVREFISCYDAFFPVMNEDSAEYVSFLREQAKTYKLKPKATADSIKKNIEDGLVRQVYPAVQKAQIHGNFGLHQSTLAMAAVVLDEPRTSEEWIRFIYQAGGLVNNKGTYRVTGGNVTAVLMNVVDRDGFGNEAGPNYNNVWITELMKVAEILDGYERNPAGNLYEHPKVKKMFLSFIDLILSGQYTPQIGDSGATGKPGLILDKNVIVRGFQQYRDPLLAQTAYFLNKHKLTDIHYGIFTANPGKLADEIAAIINREGPLQLDSVLRSGYGFAALRAGDTVVSDGNGGHTIGNAQRDTWMYFGRNMTAHAHQDMLHLGLHAYGLDLTPDFGYVTYTDENPLRTYWEDNTISHNTVVVDQAKQKPSWVGRPHHFDDGEYVKMMDIEAPHVYPQTNMYRRTTAMIKVDEENSYTVDFFRVKGGEDHHFSFHGAEGTVTTEGLKLQKQEKGTYAGDSVAYASSAYNRQSTSGFNYLTNVERDTKPQSRISVDWKVKDTWKVLDKPQDIHLRLTMLGHFDEVALADGKPPQNKPGNPTSLTYMIAHRSGKSLNSVFTSVFEPYKGQRLIQSINPAIVKEAGRIVADEEARAIKVTLANGRIDYIVSAVSNQKRYTIDDTLQFQGIFGVYAEQQGRGLFASVHDGTIMDSIGSQAQESKGQFTGKVSSFTKELTDTNSIQVVFDSAVTNEDLVGRHIFIENGYVKKNGAEARNAVYEIQRAQDAGGNTKVLQIGNVSLIRELANVDHPSRGYVYDIAAGDSFRIPLFVESVSKLYRDVAADHWAAKSIYALTDRQIVNGVSDQQFGTEQQVTRAQFAVLLVRAFQLKSTKMPAFRDVPSSSWFAKEVGAAADAGIVSGVSDTQFDPEATISREEMATMLVRAYEMKTGRNSGTADPSGFNDHTQMSRWAIPYIYAAKQSGYLSGRTANTFVPQGTVTRAEAVQAIYNVLDKLHLL